MVILARDESTHSNSAFGTGPVLNYDRLAPFPGKPIGKYSGRQFMRSVYVSITGYRPQGWRHWPRFWWHTARSITQARRAHGNLRVEVRYIRGVHHKLTIWTDESAMWAFLVNGAQHETMKGLSQDRHRSPAGIYCSPAAGLGGWVATLDRRSEEDLIRRGRAPRGQSGSRCGSGGLDCWGQL